MQGLIAATFKQYFCTHSYISHVVTVRKMKCQFSENRKHMTVAFSDPHGTLVLVDFKNWARSDIIQTLSYVKCIYI